MHFLEKFCDFFVDKVTKKEEWVVIVPSIRSSKTLEKHFQNKINSPAIFPQFITPSEFIHQVSGKEIAPDWMVKKVFEETLSSLSKEIDEETLADLRIEKEELLAVFEEFFLYLELNESKKSFFKECENLEKFKIHLEDPLVKKKRDPLEVYTDSL